MTTRFAAPTALEDALAILAADGDARPVAGGTDLVVAARQGRRALPESIVAIDRIAELTGAGVEHGVLVLGGLTSHAWLAASPDVRDRWTAVADASAIVGSPATRATGTLGGNLMNASPAAETTAPLIVFGATATLRSAGGASREVAVADLAIAPGRTVASPGELLASVRVPALRPRTGSAYIRLEYRRAMEIAVVGAAALVTLSGDDGTEATIDAACIALTAVAPTVVRAPSAEAALAGARAGRDACRAAGDAAAAAAEPIDDVRASAEYRRAMLAVVVSRAVAAAIARASSGTDAVPVPASRWTPDAEASW